MDCSLSASYYACNDVVFVSSREICTECKKINHIAEPRTSFYNDSQMLTVMINRPAAYAKQFNDCVKR